MKNFTDWENDLHQRLSAAQEELPSLGWEKLAQRMADGNTPEPPTHPIAPQRKPFALRLLKTAAPITAVAACAAVAFFVFHNNEDKMGEQVAQLNNVQTSAASPKQSVASVGNTENAKAQKSSVRSLAANTKGETPIIKEDAPCTLQSYSLSADSAKDLAAAVAAQLSETNLQDNGKKTAVLQESGEKPSAKVLQKTSYQPSFANISKASRKSVSHAPSVGFYSTAGSSANSSQAGYVMVAAAEPMMSSPNNKDVATDAVGAVVQSNLNQYADSRVTHKMPVKVGLSIHIPLTSRLAIHTGLDYTRLSSEIISGTNDAYYQTDQTLHYVGLPVSVSYAFLQTRYVDLYGAAGVEIQKCVNGRQTTNFNANNTFKASTETTESIGKSVWQSSANVSLGFQLNIVPTVGVYAEPGVSYYPSDGSTLLTVWREKPWQFSLQVGLRFSLSSHTSH